MRKAVLAGYVAMVDDCADFSVNDLQELFGEELTRAMAQPFFTAIRHVLTQL
jgi:hypothetical protein